MCSHSIQPGTRTCRSNSTVMKQSPASHGQHLKTCFLQGGTSAMCKSLCGFAHLNPAEPPSKQCAKLHSQVDVYQRCGWYRHGSTPSSSFLNALQPFTPNCVSVHLTRPLTSQLLRKTLDCFSISSTCGGDLPIHMGPSRFLRGMVYVY